MNGKLVVYSSGHQYVIEDVDYDTAEVLVEQFQAYHSHDGDDLYDVELDEGFDWFIVLAHGKIDAIAWEKVA